MGSYTVWFFTGSKWVEYHMHYAHLNALNVAQGNTVGPSSVIGWSGWSGLPTIDAAHLHFSVVTHEVINGITERFPIDLSPMKGFTPSLGYPTQCTVCGTTEDKDDGDLPIIIEANEFDVTFEPLTPHHYWNCSQYFTHQYSGYCYRAAVPIAPEWGLDPINASNQHLSPRMDYQIWIPEAGYYYPWICGRGGTVEDDTLHMGVDGTPAASADRMSGFHPDQWLWASQTLDGPRPSFYLSTGYHTINVWACENGLRIDRIIITRAEDFNPEATPQVRCAGEGLGLY